MTPSYGPSEPTGLGILRKSAGVPHNCGLILSKPWGPPHAELADGVAVSFNPYGDSPTYYVNTQLGEDLITNPEAYSTPEELLVFYDTGHYVVRRTSSLVPRGRLLMSDAQIVQLAQHLSDIHDQFEALYAPEEDEPFAMEIEFKITEDDILAIKQARPWVY